MIRSRHTSLVGSKQADEKKIRTGKEAVAENPERRNLMYIRTAAQDSCSSLFKMGGYVPHGSFTLTDDALPGSSVKKKSLR